jgi:hypothetical protein
MIKITIMMRLGYKKETVCVVSMGQRGKMKRIPGGEEDQSMLLIYVWGQHKETHQMLFLKGRVEKGGQREYGREGEFSQNILYLYMELSHGTPLHY